MSNVVMGNDADIVDRMINFAILIYVENANPNGDPATGKPRIDKFTGKGIIGSECIARKIRNYLQDNGYPAFVQSHDHRIYDNYRSQKARLEKGNPDIVKMIKSKTATSDDICKAMCERYMDVRMFGDCMALFKSETCESIKGCVNFDNAYTVGKVRQRCKHITRCCNSVSESGKGSETMGRKYYVSHGLYSTFGTVFPDQAARNGFTWGNAALLKNALCDMMDNDASTTRPSTNVVVAKVYWWVHEPNVKVKKEVVKAALHVVPKVDYPMSMADYDISVDDVPGVGLDVISFM